MRKMRKISVMLSGAIVAALILMPLLNSAQASIEYWTWLPPYVYRGYDYYYDEYVYAYLNGSTAAVKIPVYQYSYSPYMNVTAVSIVFDWGLNKTLDYSASPVRMDYGAYRIFDINLTAAEVSQASNVMAHSYAIYVQHNYGTWSRDWGYYGYKFAVYSQEQKDYRDLSNKFWNIEDSYSPYNFYTIKGHLLATQATAEAYLADDIYMTGNFTDAKTHIQTALNLYDQAFAIEESKGVAFEDAELDSMQKEANATVKMADAAMLEAQAIMNQSYGYLLLGLGFVLIGVGAIAYGIRKPPKPVQS